MDAARPLRDVFADLAQDEDAHSALDVLRASGHPDLPDGLVAEAVGSYADTAPLEVAEHLSTYVMAHSPVPQPDLPDVDPASWLTAMTSAPVVDDTLPLADDLDGDVLHASTPDHLQPDPAALDHTALDHTALDDTALDHTAPDHGVEAHGAGHESAIDFGHGTDAGGDLDSGHLDSGHLDSGHVDSGYLGAVQPDDGHLDQTHLDLGHPDPAHLDLGHLDPAHLDLGHLDLGHTAFDPTGLDDLDDADGPDDGDLPEHHLL